MLKDFSKVFFKEWGFTDGKDYITTVLGLKALPFFTLQLFGTAFGTVLAFFASWIWNPPGAAILIIGMTLVNARYGYLFSKFHRTFSIVVSDLLIMSMLHIAIKYYPYYEFAADLLFGWLLAHKGRAILHHMALLRLQEGGLTGYLKEYLMKVLKQKVGADLVDNIQDHEHNNEEK
jgi:hypothetical protein